MGMEWFGTIRQHAGALGRERVERLDGAGADARAGQHDLDVAGQVRAWPLATDAAARESPTVNPAQAADTRSAGAAVPSRRATSAASPSAAAPVPAVPTSDMVATSIWSTSSGGRPGHADDRIGRYLDRRKRVGARRFRRSSR